MAAVREPCAEGVELIDEKIIAEGEREKERVWFDSLDFQRKLWRWRTHRKHTKMSGLCFQLVLLLNCEDFTAFLSSNHCNLNIFG